MQITGNIFPSVELTMLHRESVFCEVAEIVIVFTTFSIAGIINKLSTPFQYSLQVTHLLDGPSHPTLTVVFQL